MTFRHWTVMRSDHVVARRFTRSGAAREMARIKRTVQSCRDRLGTGPQDEHFKKILTLMSDTLRIERCG